MKSSSAGNRTPQYLSASSEQENRYSFPRRTIFATLAGTMLVSFIATLDQTIVGTALPRIIADLHNFDLIAWVTTIYLLTSTVTIPLYGKLSDLIGRKAILLFCIVVFLAGSILSGFSQSMLQLILFRGFQGIGAGGLQPIASAVVGDLFPPRERGKWQSLTTSSYALATVAGPLLGGWLTDSFSWRWIFYVNLPFGIAALLVVIFVMPALNQGNKNVQIDYIGALLVVLGTVPLLLGFSWAGSRFPWLSFQSLGLFSTALLIFIVLIIYSARQERLGHDPVIEPSLFKQSVRIFSIGLLATMLIGIALVSSVYFIPFFLQSVIGFSATNSGLTLAPMMLTIVVGAVIGGVLVAVTGHYKWIALSGVLITIAGILLLLRLDTRSTLQDIIEGMLVFGVGIGIGMSIYTVAIQNALPGRIGQATAALSFFRQLGQSIGLALASTVVITTYVSAFHNAIPLPLRQAIPAQVLAVFENPASLLSGGTLTRLRTGFASQGAQGSAAFTTLVNAVKFALAESIHNAFLLSLVLMLFTLIIVCFLKEIPLRRRKDGDNVPAEK